MTRFIIDSKVHVISPALMDLALGHGLDLLVCHFDVFPETIKYQFPGPHRWLLFSCEYQIFLTVDKSPFLADTEDHV